MNTIDAICEAIELIDAGDPADAAMRLQALVLHLDSIAPQQRLSYAKIQAYITNTWRIHAGNNMLTQAQRKQYKSEADGAAIVLPDLMPAERQEVEQLSFMEV